LRILYVTRKYPPSTGGMENAAFELYSALAKKHEITLVKWGGSNKWLPIVYPKLLLQSVWHGLRSKPDAIYLQDGMMAPLGWVVRGVLRRPTVISVHGLEATYKNPLYKVLVTPFIPKQDAIVVGSSATKKVIESAFPGTKPYLITYGLKDEFYRKGDRDKQLKEIAKETDIPLSVLREAKLLHTNGRLIPRKGVLWFTNNIMPQLAESNQKVLYLVSGKGPDKEAIEVAIRRHGLEESVKLLGRVSDNLLYALYNAADLFIMPNIPVANDMEGFGLVATEASSCGTFVVGSKLEGIQDAVQTGKNGILLEPRDVKSYVSTIKRELKASSVSKESVRQYTLERFSWGTAADAYAELMQQLADKR
jgi:glycosyltransferase involved in cell wall biosynthesis